mgnify:CR=1 FL=1
MVFLRSAYEQLTPTERAFVDNAVHHIEGAGTRAKEPISVAARRVEVQNEIVSWSRGMMEKPMVLAAITERVNSIAIAQELTAQKIIRETVNIATANMGDYIAYDDDGNPYFTLAKCTREQLSAIKTLEIETSGKWGEGKTKIKVGFHEKLTAIKLAGEYIGMWNPDNPHYRAQQAENAAALPADTTPEAAADAYQRYLEG